MCDDARCWKLFSKFCNSGETITSSPESIHIEWGDTEWGVRPLLAASHTAGWISTRWMGDADDVPEMPEDDYAHKAMIEIVQYFTFLNFSFIYCLFIPKKNLCLNVLIVLTHISLSYVIVLQL